MSEISVGNIVRYVSKSKSNMTRGELGEVMRIESDGRARIRVLGRSPQYVEVANLEFVSATDTDGIFSRKNKGSEPSKEPAPKPENPEPASDPQPDPYGPDPALWVKVMECWPRFEDGSPVLIGDFVTNGDQTSEVGLISIESSGYEVTTLSGMAVIGKFGETAQRGQDSLDLVWEAARDAINAKCMNRELFEQLCERASKVRSEQ